MNKLLYIHASQALHTPAGNLLYRMYYGGYISKILISGERSGYPHNGGEHTLTLRLNLSDLEAFLALTQEVFKGHVGLPDFFQTVSEEMRSKYPSVKVNLPIVEQSCV